MQFGVVSAAHGQYILNQYTAPFSSGSTPPSLFSQNGTNLPWRFLGLSWGLGGLPVSDPISVNLGKIAAIDSKSSIGLQASGETYGAVGFKFKPYYSGGNISYQYNGSVAVITDSALPIPEKPAHVNVGFALGAGSYYSTTSPSIGLGAAFTAAAYGRASVSGAFFTPPSKVWSAGPASYPSSMSTRDAMMKAIQPSPNLTAADQVIPLTGTVVNGASILTNTSLAGFNGWVGALLGKVGSPVSVTVSVPNLAANSKTNTATNSLSSSVYSPFVDLQLDLMALVSALTGESLPIDKVLSGNYAVPDTDYQIQWDIAKVFADVNFGFQENVSMGPVQTTLGLTAFNLPVGTPLPPAKSLLTPANQVNLVPSTDSNHPGWDYVFPPLGYEVYFVPTVTTGFQINTDFNFGVNGDVGFTPIDFSLTGDLSPGVWPVNFTLDPATYKWTGSPSTFQIIPRQQVSISPQTAALNMAYTRPIIAADPTHLPPTIFGAPSQSNLLPQPYLVANSLTVNPDTNTATFNVVPQQGFQFFMDYAGTTTPGTFAVKSASIQSPTGPSQKLSTQAIYDPNGGTVTLTLSNAAAFLQPNSNPYTISLSVSAQASPGGAVLTKSYTLPVYVTSMVPAGSTAVMAMQDGELVQISQVSQKDFPTPESSPVNYYLQYNPGTVNSQTTWLIDGKYTLPGHLSAAGNGSSISFALTSAMYESLVGKSVSIQLVNPNYAPGGIGNGAPLLGPVSQLFFVAPAPAVSDIKVNGLSQSKQPIQLTDQDQWVSLVGSGFTPSTTVREGPNPLQVAYSTPSILRVKVPVSLLQEAVRRTATRIVLTVTTPLHPNVPADALHPAVNSGGEVKFNLLVGYPIPTINPVAGVVIQPVAAGAPVSVNLAVTHLMPETRLLVHGLDTPFSVLGDGTVKFTIPASAVQPGLCDIVFKNVNASSASYQYPIVHPVAQITSAKLQRRVFKNPPLSLEITGTNITPDTMFKVLDATGKVVLQGPYKAGIIPSGINPKGKYTVQLVNPWQNGISPSVPLTGP